jgi:class 3 adenylate cyclase
MEKVIGNASGIATYLSNIGAIYYQLEKYSEALRIEKEAEKLYFDLGVGLYARNQINIGLIFSKLKNYSQAVEYCKKGLQISEEKGAIPDIVKACNCLYLNYKTLGKGEQALVYLEKKQINENKLQKEETSKKLQQMEFAKQMLKDSIAAAEKERLLAEAHKEEVRQKNNTRNIFAGGSLVALILAGGIYSRLVYTRKAKAIIEKEKDRSENLLLNILPADIAAELKEKGKTDARDFDLVSILFTDFKGFTATSEKLSAQDLVTEINTCFEAFDGIVSKYNVEKIKTIGDAYMAAGGLPVPIANSVKSTVLAALEMQDFISKRKLELEIKGLPAFEMRVGIHTGPVVAGIVGVKKFQYDVWGDTVNTASRMESNGEVGKINISQATYEQLIKSSDEKAEYPEFIFESRGMIDAKGKGKINMYFVSKRT